MKMRFFIIIFAVAIAHGVINAQAAQKEHAPWTGPYADELPYPTGDIWLTMGWNKKQTSSKCIGKINTPLCALETFLACRTRNDVKLCILSQGEWFNPELQKRWPHDPYPRTGLMRYYILDVERYTEEVAASIHSQESYRQDKAGDISISLDWEMCGQADKQGRLSDCCAPTGFSNFVLRRQSDGWHMVHYFHPVGHSYIRYDVRPEDYRAEKETIKSSALPCDKIKASITGPRLPGE